mmetsp:Transcript_24743/g.62618  ORF Transcript_24743/g.62618 Transcript_24743/m.62618 type:complete len:219 (-) Transcript_24743:384-1040(-)
MRCASSACQSSSSMVCMPGIRPDFTWFITRSYASPLLGCGMWSSVSRPGDVTPSSLGGGGCDSSRPKFGSSRRACATCSSIESSDAMDCSESAAPYLLTCSHCCTCSRSISSASSSRSSASPPLRPRTAASFASAASIWPRATRSALMRAIFCSRERVMPPSPVPLPPAAVSSAPSPSVINSTRTSDPMKASRHTRAWRRWSMRRSWSIWRVESSAAR